MKWELARHDWAALRDPALAAWIEELVSAEDPDRANELLSLIESEIVAPNGAPRIGASAAASCLVLGLLSASPVVKAEMLYLLFQLAGRVVSDPESKVTRSVKREIGLGLPIYAEIAEARATSRYSAVH